jgi:hypothetical protein
MTMMMLCYVSGCHGINKAVQVINGCLWNLNEVNNPDKQCA